MKYDTFQKKAISSTECGNSVIVCAPTGAGKTAIAEHVIKKCIENNEGVIYTSPIKSLSNQKFRDFGHIYGKHIGILTGDVSINANAPVLIMTTEIFRNTLFENPSRLKNMSWIIFDEVHYIDDYERGTVWEESIIFCPPHMRILALSATIPNSNQIANWARSIHKHPIETVIEKKRPVPLHHLFQSHNRIFSSINQLRKNVYLGKNHKSSRWEKHKKRPPSNKVLDFLKNLNETDKTPIIYFSFSRKRCAELAFEANCINFVNPDEKQKLTSMFKGLLEKFDLKNEASALKLWPLIENGIAYHHAGLLPSLKEVIEQLFTSRLIKLIFTTETFALGINMPAKTVVFDELRKFHGTHYGPLQCRDYYQMAGRAGRRGIDSEGFVYSRINPHRIEFNQVKNIIFSDPEPINSQFNLSYASLLHLYAKWQEKLYNVYPQSLHYFQSKKKTRKNALALLETKIAILKEMNYISKHKLSYKGIFASRVYGYELLLTELFATGVLESLSCVELNIVLVSLCFEPRKNQMDVALPLDILAIQDKVLPLIKGIRTKERRHRIRPFSKKPYFNLGIAIKNWSQGMTLALAKAETGADEGEIVRYFRMVIQILKQLRAIPFINPQFKDRINESLRMVNRDEVDAEKQLREGL
ncbi:MAG: DEAD/DEAH box helicase [Candidatus Omnitrophica bacterium]|nr:DEAD/DEAH box helicase [Candidatus Omnitrophota bacterium]